MNHDSLPLDMFEVDCDGSACGSDTGLHVHGPQYNGPALNRVVVRDGRRIRYEEITP